VKYNPMDLDQLSACSPAASASFGKTPTSTVKTLASANRIGALTATRTRATLAGSGSQNNNQNTEQNRRDPGEPEPEQELEREQEQEQSSRSRRRRWGGRLVARLGVGGGAGTRPGTREEALPCSSA